MKVLGIDVGGSGIKGAPVNLQTGELIAERYRLATPQPSVPDAISDVVAEITEHFAWKGPLGCTFPAVIKKGVAYTAANVDKSWLGTNIEELITTKTGNPALLLNDADAAGLAEMQFGAGKGREGVVIMLTFGTGIGTAIFIDGKLLPNTEFGHLEIRCKEAEHQAAARIRKEESLGWKRWVERVNEYLQRMENLFWPDLFIFGGGVSQKQKKFFHLLKTRTEIVPAQLQNQAGIIGAALAAGKHFKR